SDYNFSAVPIILRQLRSRMNMEYNAPRCFRPVKRYADSCEKPDDHVLEIRVETGKLTRQFMLIFAEDGAERVVEALFHQLRGARLFCIELFPLRLDFRSQALQFMGDIVYRT